MATNSLIYSNARVKTMENSLLTSEKITRMVFAENLEDGVKVLTESGYGGELINDAKNFDDIILAETNRVAKFVVSAIPKDSGMECLVIGSDYHNAKVLAKAKYGKVTEYEFMLMPAGLVDVEMLKDSVMNDNYSSLPAPMARALGELDSLLAVGKINPQEIDIRLEKAMYEQSLSIVRKAKNKSLVNYVQANIDFSNISTFVRCKRVGMDERTFKESFIEGGKLDRAYFLAVYDQSVEVLGDKLKYSDYRQVSDSVTRSDMNEFEVVWDNYLLAIFKEDKNDLFSISPLAGFYVAKKIEQKVVRMILTLLKNNIDKSQIKARLRDYYV